MSNYPENIPDEEFRYCPRCGTQCSITDSFCRGCGHRLIRPPLQDSKPVHAHHLPPRYQRKYSVPTRFVKLLTSPREAMEDIALAPDYTGAIVIAILEIIMTIAAVILTLQKIEFTGAYASQVLAAMNSILGVTIVITPIIFGVRWLVKSWLVRVMCDEGSWDFTSAAAVTGYAYLGSTIFTIFSLVIGWILLPTITINTTNLELALIQLEQYTAEMTAYQFSITLPIALIGMLWKSYLGGLGTNTGTRRRCSVEKGTAVFVLLGLIGLLINFFL